MSEKPGKKKAKKAPKERPSVMGSLSATRPEPIGRRASTRGSATSSRAGAASASRTRATAKPKAAAKPKATAAQTAKPKAAANGHSKRPVKAPQPVGSPTRKVPRVVPPPDPERRPPVTPPSGPEFVTTAVQAVGELAQIGLTVGGQVLRRAARRIPRP
jgi:hypothetical protein